ncbi:hypothetical protein F5Y12DRAFT_729607 [Xylaria sp. FL1777]|nr:hypothetical protein F5Y12DRAFT_729607 [Xylaria sp. FL1777]
MDGAASYFAVLIGVNFYPEKYSSLHGCVSDIEQIAKFLANSTTRLNIRKLTASSSTEAHSRHPPENPKSWPTYQRVIANLEEVYSHGVAGDFVYIHYSGHGTTTKSIDDNSNSPSEHLALVLLEEEESDVGIRYLRGPDLAISLKRLVDKGLIVTLVLDCCFSGGVMRDSASVRYLPYDPAVDKAYPAGPAPPDRNASLRLNWLVNPDGYSILTACGPTETARELVVKGGRRQGALSYFLLRTFSKLGGVCGKQELIYHHVCARFRSSTGFVQTPMFYGNKNLCFFGHSDQRIERAPIPIVETPNGALQLQAGRAHGVTDGDEFLVYPLSDANSSSRRQKEQAVARVINTRSLTSELKLDGPSLARIETGWMAAALTCLRLRRYLIQLDDRLMSTYPWATTVDKRRSLNIREPGTKDNEQPVSFFTISTQKGYEIQNQFHEIILNRSISHLDYGMASQLLDELEHIVKFTLVKELANEVSPDKGDSLRNYFNIRVVNGLGQSFGAGCLHHGSYHMSCSHPECVIEVKDDDKLQLIVQNRLPEGQILYMHIFNLSSSYEVENILHGDYLVVPPCVRDRSAEVHLDSPGICKLKLHMELSIEVKEQGYDKCEDIVKVLLTSQPASFLSLELPKLGEKREPTIPVAPRLPEPSQVLDDWAAVNFRIQIRR